MMSINTDKFNVFKANKIAGSSNPFKTKKKCIKFHFPEAMNRVGHDLCKVKAEYTMKAKLLHLYFLF